MSGKPGQKSPEYTDDQKTVFLDLAQKEGVSRAIRELGYPTHATATKWAKDRGVDVSLSTVMKAARDAHVFYSTEDLVMSIEETMSRIMDDIRTKADISADDYNKYSNALSKMVDKHLVLKGKAASISETRNGADIDSAVSDLVEEMKRKNSEEKEQHNI